MGIREWFTRDEGEEAPSYREVGLDQMLSDYELIGVTDSGAVLVTDKDVSAGDLLEMRREHTRQSIRELAEPADSRQMDGKPNVGKEIGGSAETLYRRTTQTDYNPDLVGSRGIDNYRIMRNDAVVRTTLRVQKTPILAARWFIQPASQEPADVAKAKFIWDNLTRWMTQSFGQFLIESLLMCDYGMYAFEKVFAEYDWVNPETGTTERKIIWRKFAPRPPYEVIAVNYDGNGGPESLELDTDTGPKTLDIHKALVFTFDKEAGDLWGTSVLRSAYKHWFFKEQLYKIDAIQKERHGIGIPIIHLPPNFDDADKLAANRLGENLRSNEKAHVVLPPKWEVMFLKLEGQRVDALESAQHHADKLYENVMANFLTRAGTANTDNHDMFVKSARFIAEIIRDVINHYAIPQLMRFNWSDEDMPNGYPQLHVRRLGDERDWRTISFAIRNFIGAKAMKVDDPLRAWIRDEMDLPLEDEESGFYVGGIGDPEWEAEQAAAEREADPEEPEEDVDDATGGTPRQPRIGTPRQAATPPVGTPQDTGRRDVGGQSGEQ